MEPAVSLSLVALPNVVLQCSGCKTIVGDTAEFVAAATIASTKIIAIRAATDVSVDSIPQTTTVGAQPFTYFHVCCSGCGGVVGRMYTAAPPEAQPLINAFSFDASKCSSYRLGSADMRVSGEAGGAPAAAPAAPDAAGGAAVAELLARVEALEAEMLKMQGMILLHDGQLQQLPGYPAAAGAAAGGGAPPPT